MIRSFRHKGLKRLFEEDDARGLKAEHADKVRRILSRLDVAMRITDMDLPGYRLHALKGDLGWVPFCDGAGELEDCFPV